MTITNDTGPNKAAVSANFAVSHKPPRPTLKFRILGASNVQTAYGQEARSLAALIAAGNGGITALEVSTWALRLAHYCYKHKKMGLTIECVREAHGGPVPGKHGRYFLKTPVEVIHYNLAAVENRAVAA